MTSTPVVKHRSQKQRKEEKVGKEENSVSGAAGESKRLSFLLVANPRANDGNPSILEEFEDEQPPTFIPEPPPASSSTTATLVDSSSGKGKIPTLQIVAPPHVTVVGDGPLHPTQAATLDGKVTLDLLSQRITRNCPSPVENMSVSQFLHNKKNIWAMYDRPYDEGMQFYYNFMSYFIYSRQRAKRKSCSTNNFICCPFLQTYFHQVFQEAMPVDPKRISLMP